MRFGALLAIALVAAVLSGCASNKADTTSSAAGTSTNGGTSSGGSTGTGTTSGTSGGATTSSGAPGTNHAPAIQAFTVNRTSGGAPLAVHFQLNATDADGDALSFTLSFGDGTANQTGSLPSANVTHTFGATGNYTARLVVSDGHASADQTLLVRALGAAGAAAGQLTNLAWSAGSTDQTGAAAPNPGLNCADDQSKGVDYDSFSLDTATVGLPFKATITDAAGGADIASWGIYFNLPDCSDYSGTFHSKTSTITDKIPAGSGPYVYMLSTGGAQVKVTFASGSKIA